MPFLLLLGAMAQAGTLTVRGPSGSSVAQITSSGVVRNAAGSTIGRIDPRGTVRGESSTIGRFNEDGEFRNSSGSRIGSVSEDGVIRGRSGQMIGRLSGCTLRSSSAEVSRFSGCDDEADLIVMAAYLLYFTPIQ